MKRRQLVAVTHYFFSKPVLQELGITTSPKYEQRITFLEGSGSADAVYGFGVIEYERPGRIATPAGRKEVVKQLANYLVGKARELAPTRPVESVKKMIGIGIDGREVMYLRYLKVTETFSDGKPA
jgi:hypothetical protein